MGGLQPPRPPVSYASVTEKRLNNCLLLRAHGDLTDELHLVDIAKGFISAKVERQILWFILILKY